MADVTGRRIAKGELPPLGIRHRGDLQYNLATVLNVDPDRYLISVEYFDRKGTRESIKITQPYAGVGSYIAAMPEKGSLVLIAEVDSYKWLLTYLPNYSAALDGNTLEVWPSYIQTGEQNTFHYRFRKLMPGQIALGSKDGAEIFMANDLEMKGSGGSHIIRSWDKSIISTGFSHNHFAPGVWATAGIIRRNSTEKENTDMGHFNTMKAAGDTGKVYYELCFDADKDQPTQDTVFSEYLVEVEDTVVSELPANDVNSLWSKNKRDPIAVLALGNMVGNNQDNDNYAKVLGVQLFKGQDDFIGDFSLVPLTGHEWSTKGIAIGLFKPERRNSTERGAFFGVDKEGHFYQYIPAATGHGIGNGRSMSILAKGNKKEVWGAEGTYYNSWDLSLDGGIRWQIGSHNDSDANPYRGRSMDIRTTKRVFFMYGKDLSEKVMQFSDPKKEVEDYNRYGKVEKIEGFERREVEGTRETRIAGSDYMRIDGLKFEKIAASVTTVVGGSLSINVGDMFTESVSKEKSESFGSRKTTINSGSSELTISINATKGDIVETINPPGSRKLTVTTGNIEETILTKGDRKLTITQGNFKTNISTKGDFTVTTTQGDFVLRTVAGKGSLNSTLGMTLDTSVASNMDIKGGSINLVGKTQATFGVVTDKNHQDYITGAFLKGSSTVKATV